MGQGDRAEEAAKREEKRKSIEERAKSMRSAIRLMQLKRGIAEPVNETQPPARPRPVRSGSRRSRGPRGPRRPRIARRPYPAHACSIIDYRNLADHIADHSTRPITARRILLADLRPWVRSWACARAWARFSSGERERLHGDAIFEPNAPR